MIYKDLASDDCTWSVAGVGGGGEADLKLFPYRRDGYIQLTLGTSKMAGAVGPCCHLTD